MRPLPLVHASYLLQFERWLLDHGIATAPLWEAAGLSRAAAEGSPNRFLPTRAVYRFVEEARALLGTDDLGYRVASGVDFLKYPAFVVALAGNPTLEQALHRLARELRSDANRYPVWIRSDAGCLWFCFGLSQPKGTPGEGSVEQHDVTLFIRFIRHAIGSGWYPPGVQLARCREPERKALAGHLPGAEMLRGPFAAVAVERDAARATVRSPASLPAGKLRARSAPEEFVDSLRAALHATLSVDESRGIQGGARLVGVSVRTLQRRLAEKGTSYSEVVDSVRHEVAVAWVGQTHEPLADIATGLGYSDPAHFTRAFRRWEGVPPRRYRQQHMDGMPPGP